MRDGRPLFGADEIPPVDYLGGFSGELVLVRFQGLPVILRQALVTVQGLLDTQDLHVGMLGLAMDLGPVELEIGSATIGLVNIHPGHAQLLPVLLAYLTQVRQAWGIRTLECIVAKIHLG